MWELLPEHIKNPNPEIFLSDNYVVLDYETTSSNGDYGDARNERNSILCASWRCGPGHPENPGKLSTSYNGEYESSDLIKDIRNADFVVAHNAKYELSWLKRSGVRLEQVVVFCTQIAERVIAGNRPWGNQQSLENCLRRRQMGTKNFIGKLIRWGIPSEDLPRKWLSRYCEQDVLQTEQLFLDQRGSIERRGLLNVYYTRSILTPCLADIEWNGLCVDKQRARILYTKYNRKLIRLKNEFNRFTGGINFRSPTQIAEFVYGKGKANLGFRELRNKRGQPIRTPGGKPRTDSATLEKLTANTDRQKHFLKLYREINKTDHAVTKILKKFRDCVKETDDGILYASLNQCNTDTGRLSSTGAAYNVQFQNINREFKPLICCRNPGWSFTEFDQAQLEFRGGMFLGQDKQGMEDIQNKMDVHSFSASHLFSEDWVREGGSLTEFTNDFKPKTAAGKEIRQGAKAETFGPLYGREHGSPEQMAYYQAFRQRYYDTWKEQERWHHQVITKKFLRTITGMIYYWPHATNPLQSRVKYQICNYPVQMLATADIVPISLVLLWHLVKLFEMKTIINNTVHDSVLAEVPPDEQEKYNEIAKWSFEEGVIIFLKKIYGIDFNVPLEAEGSSNTHWNTSKEWEQEYLNV